MKVAAVQMCSGDSLNENLQSAGLAIREARKRGAELAVLPENFAFSGARQALQLEYTEAQGKGPIQDFLSDCARRNKIWIVGGTLPMTSDTQNKVWSACLIYASDGSCAGVYHKIHLFDVYIEGSSERYAESEIFKGGHEPLVLDTPIGRLGVAICYDLRFPEQFRALVSAGARIVALPAAFTAETGKDHWECLVRARAIENQVYFIAAAQTGELPGGRKTWGHSMIVDPWGNILAQRETETGVVVATLERQLQERLRTQFPCLNHRVMLRSLKS